jgi:hypothetical protein
VNASLRAGDVIRDQVLTWSGVSAGPHRFGGVEFRLGRRELGHLHGDFLLDIPFPLAVRDALVAAGSVQPHHILPKSGWVSFRIRTAEDIEVAVSLLRRSFDIASARTR